MSSADPLACPFCGAPGLGRIDGPDPDRPFMVRCSRERCAGSNAIGHAEAEDALSAWNQRIQPKPENPMAEASIDAYAAKDLIRGELVYFTLDRSGYLTSSKFDFSTRATPLMKKPSDSLNPQPLTPSQYPALGATPSVSRPDEFRLKS